MGVVFAAEPGMYIYIYIYTCAGVLAAIPSRKHDSMTLPAILLVLRSVCVFDQWDYVHIVSANLAVSKLAVE